MTLAPNAEARTHVAIKTANIEKAAMVEPSIKAQKHAREIEAKLKEAGARSTLESLREQTPINRKRDEVLQEARFTKSDIDTDGKTPKRTAEENKRYQEAKTTQALAHDFLEKGFDKLNPDQRKDAIAMVKDVVMMLPEANAILDALGRDDADKMVGELLKDPEFASLMRPIFEKAQESGKGLEQSQLTALKAKLQGAERSEERKREAYKANEKQIKALGDQIHAFNNTPRAERNQWDGKIKSRQLEELIKAEPKLNADRRELDKQKAAVSREITRLHNITTNRKDVDAESKLIEEEERLKGLDKQIEGIDDQLKLKSDLQAERANLDKDMKACEEKVDALDDEWKSATTARLIAQADFDSASLTRTAEEGQYVDKLKGVFTETAKEFFQKRLKEAEDAENKVLAEEKAKAKSNAEKNILDTMMKRWNGKDGKYNKKQIDSDFEALMVFGPEQLMKDMLKMGIPKEELEEFYKDKELVANLRSKLAEKVISKKLKTGKITEQDADKLFESEWGKPALESAINNNSEAKKYIDKLKEDGLIKGDVFSWLKGMDNKKRLGWLALILALAGGGVAVFGPLGLSAATLSTLLPK